MSSVALVTGASGGIGLELSRLLARDGHDLVVVAQNPERLARAADDLATEFHVRVNAGFGLRGPFAELDLVQQLKMIQVNVTALSHLSGLLLPGMLHRGRGRMLQVASTAAFQAGPLMAVYYATKAYVLSFSEALANETRGSGVTVTALCPGPTETGFERRAGLERTRLFRAGVMDAASFRDASASRSWSVKRWSPCSRCTPPPPTASPPITAA